jgi:hypothetical protein
MSQKSVDTNVTQIFLAVVDHDLAYRCLFFSYPCTAHLSVPYGQTLGGLILDGR